VEAVKHKTESLSNSHISSGDNCEQYHSGGLRTILSYIAIAKVVARENSLNSPFWWQCYYGIHSLVQ